MWLLNILPKYLSRWNSQANKIKNLVKIHWHIRSYFSLFPLFLLVSIVMTVINTCSVFVIDLWVGRINLGTLGATLWSCCSVVSGSLIPLTSTISDAMFASQSSSLSFVFSKSPFQSSQFSVSEMLPGALYSVLPVGWQLLLLIRHTSNTSVRPPRRSFADKAGGRGDLSDNLNAAAPSCRKCDQDALTIISVCEIYPATFICMFWARESFCIARRCRLPCDISKWSWTLAILCNFLSSTALFISKSFSSLVVSNAG